MKKNMPYILVVSLSVFGQMLFSNEGEIAFQYIRENQMEKLAKMLEKVQEQYIFYSSFEEKDLSPLTVAEIDGKHFMSNRTLRKLSFRNTDRQIKPNVKQVLNQAINLFLMRLYLESQKNFSYNYTEIAQKLAAKLNKFLSLIPEASDELSQILRVNLKECKDAYAKDTFLKLPNAQKILKKLRVKHAVKIYPENFPWIE